MKRQTWNLAISPDGIGVSIPFNTWEVGMSVFVPTLNASKLRQQLRPYFKHQGWGMQSVERVEGGKLGLRIWRTS
jgi:hypothetical protein